MKTIRERQAKRKGFIMGVIFSILVYAAYLLIDFVINTPI